MKISYARSIEKQKEKEDGKISDKKWRSLDRNRKRSAAVQMSFH